MTTLTSPDGETATINARRTESLDAPNILKLVQPSTEQLFGRVNVVNLIEKAVLAVTLSNEDDELLAHAAFFDYPNVPGVDQADWQAWINKYYNCDLSTPLNTLFMHYFVAKPEYARGAAKEIIRTMYNAVPDLHYCYLVVPQGVYPDKNISDYFVPITPIDGELSANGFYVTACNRSEHAASLFVRTAKVEDHDDLTPIFNRQSNMLQRTYGDFFLAELIEAQNEHMQCIVAEVEGTAVGFMSACDDVSLDLLNQCFELGPFHGLHKPHENDILEPGKSSRVSPAPKEKEESRPASVTSQHSVTSQNGNTDAQQVDKPDSQPAEEGTKVKPALGDATNMGQSTSSLLSESSVAESIKSAAESYHSVVTSKSAQSQHSRTSLTGSGRQRTPLKAAPPKRFVPTYCGPSNSFCIQLFCIDERYEMRSQDFLGKLFELFPERDFAVITVPHLVPEFPLLQGFVRVTPRCPSTLAQELYVFHRSGLLKSFVVRPACKKDDDQVEKLVSTLDLHGNLLADLTQFNRARRDQDGTEINAFVAEVLDQIVGVAIVRREEDIEYIRSHYNIEDFIYFNHHRRDEHGHLHHFALNPVFKHYSKHFLKEILRQAHKTCLYYPLYPSYVEKEVVNQHSLVSALHDMVPVRSRRQITYPRDILGMPHNLPSDRVLEKQQSYALNHINRKLTLEPKVTVNARIVVVGASDVGISFLETFAFCPHLRFNNLTMISPHGLPGELPPDTLRDNMLGSSECYTEEDYATMSLRTWVNVVYGKMTFIDRNKKFVVVNGDTIVPYEHLVLCTGSQYQFPAPTEADISKLATTSEAPHRPDRRYKGVPPKNLYIVNDAYDSAVVLYEVENNLLNTEGKALVYGNSLDAYCCVQTLLTMGVPGERIILVEPPLNYQTRCFNNITIEDTIFKAMKDCGIQIFSDFTLAQWNDGKGGEEIYAASFTSSTKPMRLECSAVFAFYQKQVDVDAFKAINDACLVYDGRLVIDAEFHTNDPSIRGAGSLTKFQRSYHADQWTHTNFNSKEVGIQLAMAMLRLFDPTLEPQPEVPQDILKLIPMYRAAKVTSAVLPGGYNYLHVGKPGLNTPLDALMAQNDYGRELITGTPGGSPEYFRLHVNQYKMVETITCLSKKVLNNGNMMCLYNVHERYLNNLLSRFDEGLIKDLYSYFKEAWCLAIFHDRFPDFKEEVRELLITKPSPDVEALEEKVRQMIEDDLTISKSQRKQLDKDYLEGGAKRAVDTRLLSFLTYNYYHLPMYAKPGML
ncbi:unnamed protein product [Owenia fusiformis]|uniref:Cilia- and flagella-associated protein 61 N-terminal domain-containing protein n=1 Tax=Owenia fusiformis TaxID=6347 RepID=A0A8S4PEX5_OWEFU|nr:unnamed protein product [Owenia fusiformis]